MRWHLSLLLLLPLARQVHAERTIHDDLGRTVKLPDHPHRVIALVPSVTDILFSLGHGADVVGVSDFSKYPPEAKQKPHIGLPLSPNMETILSLHPDMVIGIAGLNSLGPAADLERMHLPVVMVKGSSLADIYRSIETIGNAFNDSAGAAALNSKLQAQVEKIRAFRRNKPRPSVVFAIWSDPLIVAGKHAFVTELITIAGGDSVTADVAEDWTQLSIEAVVKKQPAILILPSSWHMPVTQLAEQTGWRDLLCVQRNQVIRTDDRLELPSPVAFDALQDLATQLGQFSTQTDSRSAAQ